jgi:hypothetical protein
MIDTLQGEITSLKTMLKQKDSLLDQMSSAIKKKDSLPNNNEHLLTKKSFQPSPNKYNSGSESERSLRSLAYLMQKQTHSDLLRKTRQNEGEDYEKECLSHSQSEHRSGSSTTSIVAKCYDKSWKHNDNYQPEYDSNEDAFDREEDDHEEM